MELTIISLCAQSLSVRPLRALKPAAFGNGYLPLTKYPTSMLLIALPLRYLISGMFQGVTDDFGSGRYHSATRRQSKFNDIRG